MLRSLAPEVLVAPVACWALMFVPCPALLSSWGSLGFVAVVLLL